MHFSEIISTKSDIIKHSHTAIEATPCLLKYLSDVQSDNMLHLLGFINL